MTLKVVLDTSVVLSALVFSSGKLAWLRQAWQSGRFVPLASTATTSELIRALGYPRFKLTEDDIEILLSDYLPYVEIVKIGTVRNPLIRCRDVNDQMFLDLAYVGRAEVLVSSDKDLLTLARQTPFAIETFAQFRGRFD